jgi:hypothetical protein
MHEKEMNRSAASLLGNRGLPGSRRWWREVAAVAGAVVLSVLGGAETAAQVVDRYSCAKDSTQRTIELRRGGAGELSCEVWYGTVGKLRREAAARKTPAVCQAAVRKIHTNLVNGGFTCDALPAREQPSGSVDAAPLTREDEILQAGKAAVQRCLPRLHRINEECEDSSFKIRVVGEANTPMAIGGTDVPVLVAQARYEPGTSERTGTQYLVSHGDPATIRAIDEAYQDFGAALSADLNDDGRTELMIFTRATPRYGHASTSFAIVGDARTLGYAAVSGATDQAHAVYVLKARTGGYRDLIALTGDAVFECQYRSGYQCRKLTLPDPERRP